MPKLIQLNVSANWGSTGQISELCNQYAAQKGWEVYAAYGRYKNPGQSQLICTSRKLDVYEHYVEHRFFDNEGLASRGSTKQLIKEIERIHPDIVHLHNIHDHWLNYRILFEYLNQTNIKVVWTFHDFWAITGHCAHFVGFGCDKFKSECDNCLVTKGKLLPILKQANRNFNLKKMLFTANRNLHIVAVSDWVSENVAKSFLKSKDLRVIYNGVDTDIFKPTNIDALPNQSNKLKFFLKYVENKYVIMAVSSQWKSHSKGLNDYKRMAKILKEDEIVVLVGVPDEISKSFPQNIIGVKRTNNQRELAVLYTRADVVISLSSAETFGLTIIEGYACGTPAVVYNNTAQPALVTPETGYVVENHNWQSAYDAIQHIRKNCKAHYSEACLTLVREKYNKNRCYEKYYELYNSLIK